MNLSELLRWGLSSVVRVVQATLNLVGGEMRSELRAYFGKSGL